MIAEGASGESGLKLHEGDILLVEQVDRLSRLTAADWERLKAAIASAHATEARASGSQFLNWSGQPHSRPSSWRP
jgi:DNA invertase Pin-like site-specific DNA recombinase